jgi:TetR/AcrR family transcriptional repressor of nem operon
MDEPASVRDRVVDAALRLFARRGFASTSIADVADEAGILKGNLAYYFKTKQDLLDAVLEARQQLLWREITEGLPEDADPRATIGRLLEQVRRSAPELALHGCPVGGLASELGRCDPTLHPKAAGVLLGLERFLSAQFGRVMAPADAQACAEHLLVHLQGAAVLAQAHGDPAVVARQVEQASAWLDAVLARHPAP